MILNNHKSNFQTAWRAWLPPLLWLAASYALFLLVWLLASYWMANPLLLPGLSDVAKALAELVKNGTLASDMLASLERVFIGFFIAVVIAVPLAIVMSYFVVIRKLIHPIIVLLRPIPPIAWIPLAILWFGIGNGSSFFITALAAFFPVFINSFIGGTSVDVRYIHSAKFLGAKHWTLLTRIFLPAAFPFIWSGIKIGLGQSWMAVVTAELIAAQSGLGFMIQIHRINLETSYVLVGMVTIGVLGSLMNVLLTFADRRLFPYQLTK